MKFWEWWDANRAKYHWSLQKHYQEVWEAGVTEGLRMAQVARSDTTQGGGSQAASTEAPKPVPCQGGCPVRCAGCPRA